MTAPRIFVSPDRGAGFVRSVTQGCEFDPIAVFVADPHVSGAVNVLRVIWPDEPYTRRPLLPVSSHAKSKFRVEVRGRPCTPGPVARAHLRIVVPGDEDHVVGGREGVRLEG